MIRSKKMYHSHPFLHNDQPFVTTQQIDGVDDAASAVYYQSNIAGVWQMSSSRCEDQGILGSLVFIMWLCQV